MRDSDTPSLPVAGNVDDHTGFRAHVGRISRQSSIFFAGTIFTAVASYLFKIYVARSLGARALGIYALGMTATGLVGVFAGGGLPQTATKFVAAFSATHQYEKLRAFLWRGVGMLILLQFAAGALLMAGKNLVANRIYHAPEIARYMSVFVGLMLLGALTSFFSEVVVGYRDVTRRTVIVNFIGTPVLIICVVIFLVLGFGLWGYLLGQLITAALVLALLATVVWKLTPARTTTAPHLPAHLGNNVAFYALTLLGSQTLTFFLAQSDRIALGIFTTATDVGVYALALGLSAFVSIALQSVNQIFTPTISELHAKGDGATLSRLYRTLTKWTLGLTIPLAFSVMIFSYPLMRLFGPDFGRGWIVLVIVVTGELANCGVGSVGMILLMTGKESRLLRIQMWLTPLVILLNFVFIPIWGLIGAAIVASLTNVIANLWCLFEVKRSLTIHPSVRGYLQLVPASLLTLAVIGILRFLTKDMHAQLIAIAATILAAYAIFAATFAVRRNDEDDKYILRTAWPNTPSITKPKAIFMNSSGGAQRDRLLLVAAARLNPPLTDPNFLVLRSRRLIFEKWIAELPTQKLCVLDVGARYQPYRPLLEGRISRYIALDIEQTALVDIVASSEAIPFAANQFDVVIATQTIEYCPNPQSAAQQIHRTLKPSGELFMSVAAFAPRFVDEERWRLTPAGIRTILSSFKKVEIVAETSSLGGIVRTLNLAMHRYVYFRPVRRVYEWTVCPILNVIGLALEQFRLTKADEFAPNYSVRAEK